MLFASLALLASVGQGPAPTPSLTGNVEKITAFESATLKNKRDILVYLPSDYEKDPKRRFPVLYLHDGQNVFDGATSFIAGQEWRADETAEAMIQAGLIEPIIMVAIPNMGAERANEFLPTRFSFRGSEIGGRADAYGRMIADELKPLIDKRFRTKSDAQNTGLVGSSFGGIVTLHLGLTRSNTFGKLGVLSPSVWVDDRLMVRRVKEQKTKPRLKIWLDMGASEGADGVRDARLLRDALVAKGWRQGKDLLYYEEPGGQHNEAAWARRLPLVLNFLFGRKP